jgi:hypothetical protein
MAEKVHVGPLNAPVTMEVQERLIRLFVGVKDYTF